MLRPSYTELMEILNKNSDVDSKITSRYTIVIAAAKRARQIIDGADPLTYAPTDRAVSTAVKEMQEGMINIKFSEDPDFNVMNSGMAYTDYEGSYNEETYLNKKTIDYVMDKSDREAGMIDYGLDDEQTAHDYDADEDDMGYSRHSSKMDRDYDESDMDEDDEQDEQDYQDEEQ